jgi:DNA repair/transcription protein MET18/MMS19
VYNASYHGTELLTVQQSPASVLQRNLVALFSAALVALHKEVCRPLLVTFPIGSSSVILPQVKISVDDQAAFLDMLLVWSIHTAENALQRLSAWHVITAVVNKREQGEHIMR